MNMNITEPNHDLGHGPYSIYLFKFPDSKTYVGKTARKPEKRWDGNYNAALTLAIERAGGIDKVNKSVLRTGLNEREARFFEPFYACRYHAYKNGYNVRPAGLGCAVLQIDKETFEPIRTWNSAYQAEKALKIPRNNIIEAVKGKKRHSAGGFYWCWANTFGFPTHILKLMEKAAQKAEQSAAEHSANAEGKDAGLDKASTSC